MSYPWSEKVIDEENDLVRELISKAIQRTESSISDLQEAMGTGGRLSGNDAFRISGQVLHMKNTVAILKDILESTKPEEPVLSLDEEGELDGKA
jgi:hypothetical protein